MALSFSWAYSCDKINCEANRWDQTNDFISVMCRWWGSIAFTIPTKQKQSQIILPVKDICVLDFYADIELID